MKSYIASAKLERKQKTTANGNKSEILVGLCIIQSRLQMPRDV